ncbi:potassium-transporting ATPase subunit KdpC [Actinacidiphila bryophytorum]|nr:potassium-transporting ATPase subunit KdpC [Actinacidiphila bryophytorum]MBM9440678.1 potassium-transporting ATPase subunit KdpC [Actinacidiphila bryophytorum]MBN6545155.1 potassium-transporting ATPase subunit KdpC [Actinacidiphila bryophytorum]
MASYLPPAVRRHLSALRMLLVLTVITGVLYPLAVTGVAQAAFHHQANGSVVTQNGMSVGSSLLGQSFDLPKKNPNNPDEAARPDPKFFQPRPSAGSYDPLASGASNLGPNSPDLVKAIDDRRAAVAAFDGVSPEDVPADALTASGSGLDPDISTAYAYEQVDRVAAARGLSPRQVHTLVADHVHGRDLGFLGEPRVNVLDLNRALNALSG